MDEYDPSDSAESDDDFQRAAAAAEAEIGNSGWSMMSSSEQGRAIYAQLRRIDADHTASLFILPVHRDRLRAKADTSVVSYRHRPAPPASHSHGPASE
jgi:hypothetical protein